MKLFVGVPKGMVGVLVLGEWIEGSASDTYGSIKNSIIAVEVQTEKGIGMQMRPNPYVTVNSSFTINTADFLMSRFETDKTEKVMIDYERNMMSIRAERSGLMLGTPSIKRQLNEVK